MTQLIIKTLSYKVLFTTALEVSGSERRGCLIVAYSLASSIFKTSFQTIPIVFLGSFVHTQSSHRYTGANRSCAPFGPLINLFGWQN